MADIIMRCDSRVKGILVDAAQRSGMNLTEFMLNASLKKALETPHVSSKYWHVDIPGEQPKKRPSWARKRNGVKLSDRAVNSLVRHGYTGLKELRHDFDNGYDFKSIQNFGSRCYKELEEWIK